MSHYVVTTAHHQDPLRGDSLNDCFCTRGVAEMCFESYVDAGQALVRLIRWVDGEAVEVARHEEHLPTQRRTNRTTLPSAALPELRSAKVLWVKNQVAAAKLLRLPVAFRSA
jgi:hypothetical protein